MPITNKEYSDAFAQDFSKNIISDGEIFDENVISQSIEMIVATMFGERLFNPEFGSILSIKLFEDFSVVTGEEIINGVAAAIKKYENRVKVLESNIQLDMNQDEHYIILSIPYYILRSGKTSFFKKKIFV